MHINTVRRSHMSKIKTPNPVAVIVDSFRKTSPSPSSKDIHNQVSDYLSSTLGFLISCQEIATSSTSREEIGFSTNVIEFIQRRIRKTSEGIELDFDGLDRELMLKSLCVQIRTCIGLAHMLEMDIGGALQELAESDHARINTDKQPLFNDKNHGDEAHRRPNYMQFF